MRFEGLNGPFGRINPVVVGLDEDFFAMLQREVFFDHSACLIVHNIEPDFVPF